MDLGAAADQHKTISRGPEVRSLVIQLTTEKFCTERSHATQLLNLHSALRAYTARLKPRLYELEAVFKASGGLLSPKEYWPPKVTTEFTGFASMLASMSVCVTMLASGSRGNCAVVASACTKILVDAGISCRETFKRMRSLGEDPHTLSAILITHEHSDHVYGLAVLARKLRIPVFMTGATHQAWARALRNEKGERPQLEKFEQFESGHRFQVGDIEVRPFTIPHDAADPVGFTFRAEGIKVGIATDLGYLPVSVRDHLRGCDVLVMESNHDLEMLRGGPYPWSVKQRVMSRVGHLSNLALADFLTNDYDNSATFVVLAHLSEQNNHPEIARREAEKALSTRGGLFHNRVLLASQTEAIEPIRL